MRIRNHSNVKLVTNSCSRKGKGNLNIHVASVHEENKQFKCEFCGYSCFLKSTLKIHVESVHEKKKPFKCEICDKTFTNKKNMVTHVANVHE